MLEAIREPFFWVTLSLSLAGASPFFYLVWRGIRKMKTLCPSCGYYAEDSYAYCMNPELHKRLRKNGK